MEAKNKNEKGNKMENKVTIKGYGVFLNDKLVGKKQYRRFEYDWGSEIVGSLNVTDNNGQDYFIDIHGFIDNKSLCDFIRENLAKGGIELLIETNNRLAIAFPKRFQIARKVS